VRRRRPGRRDAHHKHVHGQLHGGVSNLDVYCRAPSACWRRCWWRRCYWRMASLLLASLLLASLLARVGCRRGRTRACRAGVLGVLLLTPPLPSQGADCARSDATEHHVARVGVADGLFNINMEQLERALPELPAATPSRWSAPLPAPQRGHTHPSSRHLPCRLLLLLILTALSGPSRTTRPRAYFLLSMLTDYTQRPLK
jgi:hypothetical protein